MKKGFKERLNDLDNAVNEKRITAQQRKYEKEQESKAFAMKLLKGCIAFFSILFIFVLVMSFLEDEPQTTPNEPATISSTEESTSSPAESEEAKAPVKKNNIGTEANPITVENCPEFAAMLACKESYDISYEKFAEEHYGEYVEFTANIQDIFSNYEYGKYWGHVLLCGGEFPGKNVAPTGPYFRDERAKEEVFDDANFGPHENLHPQGSTVKVKAILHLYDKDAQIYEIELKYLTNLKSPTETE